MRFSAARVFVKEIETAKRFYSEVMRLPVKSDGSEHGYCVFDTGPTLLILERAREDAQQQDQGLVGRFTGLSFEVPDIHAEHHALRAQGVEFAHAPELQFWGGWLATLKDPAGNSVQLVQLSS